MAVTPPIFSLSLSLALSLDLGRPRASEDANQAEDGRENPRDEEEGAQSTRHFIDALQRVDPVDDLVPDAYVLVSPVHRDNFRSDELRREDVGLGAREPGVADVSAD